MESPNGLTSPYWCKKPDVEIVNLYSRTQATLDRINSQWKIDHTTTDMHAVLDSRPQAAFVLSSNHSHFDICKLMLENNIDLYVEKPLATSAAQAETLAALADEHKCVMEVAFNRRYALLYKKAKELFEGHTIQTALVQKHRPESPHVNLFNQYLDDTIHQIDLMRYYGGELEALFHALLHPEQPPDRRGQHCPHARRRSGYTGQQPAGGRLAGKRHAARRRHDRARWMPSASCASVTATTKRSTAPTGPASGSPGCANAVSKAKFCTSWTACKRASGP